MPLASQPYSGKFSKGLIVKNFKSSQAFSFESNKVIMHVLFWNVSERPTNNQWLFWNILSVSNPLKKKEFKVFYLNQMPFGTSNAKLSNRNIDILTPGTGLETKRRVHTLIL